MTTSTPSLSGARKAAIVVMALGEARTAPIFKQMSEDEIERIAREVAAMGQVPPEVGEAVLSEFHKLSADPDVVVNGGVEQTRRLLDKTLSPESSRRIVDRVLKRVNTTAGFASLEKANPQQLSKFILGEHPQTVALIMAHMNPGNAAQLVTQLPDDMRADVLMRMASLEDISPEVIGRISSVIDQRLKSLGGPQREQHGGVRAVAELFNRLDRSVSSESLERIDRSAPDLATQIRNLMFVFEDLLKIEEVGIREIVNRADKKALTIALKGASEEIRARFFTNMSKRAGELLKEEMELMGAVRLRDVEKAQQDVVAIARKLEEEGVISTGAGAGEAYVQ